MADEPFLLVRPVLRVRLIVWPIEANLIWILVLFLLPLLVIPLLDRTHLLLLLLPFPSTSLSASTVLFMSASSSLAASLLLVLSILPLSITTFLPFRPVSGWRTGVVRRGDCRSLVLEARFGIERVAKGSEGWRYAVGFVQGGCRGGDFGSAGHNQGRSVGGVGLQAGKA
jgi:hypothetical protein